MTFDEQKKVFEEFTSLMQNTLLKKGSDYSNGEALSNFKNAGNIIGLSPELNCLSLIATKVARLGVLIHGKSPKNESVSDSILDLANYSFLLHCLCIEDSISCKDVCKEDDHYKVLVDSVQHISHPVDYSTPKELKKRGPKAYTPPKSTKLCIVCGKEFQPLHNRTTKCDECRGIAQPSAPVQAVSTQPQAVSTQRTPVDETEPFDLPRYKNGSFVIDPIANY
ncbi:MAG: hypothetical protein ACOYMF_05420 [Bacteroidales bacterium]